MFREEFYSLGVVVYSFEIMRISDKNTKYWRFDARTAPRTATEAAHTPDELAN